MGSKKEETISANKDNNEPMPPVTNMKVAKSVHNDIITIRAEIIERTGINTSISQVLDMLVKCYRKHCEEGK